MYRGDYDAIEARSRGSRNVRCRVGRLAGRHSLRVPRFTRPAGVRDDAALIGAIETYVSENPRHGFDKLYPALRPQGFGKCRLYHMYKALKLNLKRRGKGRLPQRVRTPLTIPVRANEVWSADCSSAQ